MKAILTAVAAGLMIGTFAASYAKLPAPQKTEAEQKAEAEKAAAKKAKDAADLSKAQDRAVANYKKNKGASMAPSKQKK